MYDTLPVEAPVRALNRARTLESPRTRTVLRQRATDRPMADAVQQLIRTLPCTPAPRWRYDDAKHAGRLRYRPWEPVLALIDGAIDAAHTAGRTLPEGDALAIMDRMTAYVVARLTSDAAVPALPVCVVEETHDEGEANDVEILLMSNPARADLERARDRLVKHQRSLQRLITRVDLELARHGRLTA